jgi:hypothetical protein
MNKTGIKILILFLTFIVFLMTATFVYLLKSNFDWSNVGISIGNTKLIESKEFESITDINVESKAIDVIVKESDTDSVVVEVYSNKDLDYNIEESDGKLKVYVNYVSKITFFSFGNNTRLVIKLPKTYDGRFNVDAKVGDINIDSFENLEPTINNTVGDLNIKSVKSVIVEELETGDIDIDSADTILIKKHSTGDIDIDDVNTVMIKTNTGDVNIKSIKNSFDIEGKTGDVKIDNADLKDDSRIEHKTGDVRIKSLTGAYIDASTKTGDTKVNNNDRCLEHTCTIKNNIGDIKVN